MLVPACRLSRPSINPFAMFTSDNTTESAPRPNAFPYRHLPSEVITHAGYKTLIVIDKIKWSKQLAVDESKRASGCFKSVAPKNPN